MYNLIVKLVCLALVFVVTIGSVSALDSGNLKRIEDNPAGLCQQTLVPVFDEELKDYLEFLNEHFLNSSSTSSLANTAVARFGSYRDNIDSAYNLVKVRVDGEGQQEELAAYLRCGGLKDRYISVGEEVLMRKVRASNAQKKTTVMLQKYKSINSRLRDMQLEVAQMYGYFMTFNNKLPGFLRKCFAQ